MKKPRYCIEVWGRDYDRLKDTCLTAEEMGYYGFFYGESLTDLDLDCWTVLSALIPLTKTIKLGPVITYINPKYRSLALLAKQSITFQDISDGRLEFRTGAGAASEYSVSWWEPYGIEYPDSQIRIDLFEEGLYLFWKFVGKNGLMEVEKSDSSLSTSINSNDNPFGSIDTIYHDGAYFRANGATMAKPKANIPITIAAKSIRMLQIAAQYADIWESSYLSPNQFFSAKRKFDDILQSESNTALSVGKNNSSCQPKRSIELDVIIAESDKEVENKKKILAKERGLGAYKQVIQRGLVGTPTEIQTMVSTYASLGVDQFLLAFQDPLDIKSIELFMKSVK
ncbi:MAG TPA: LLM class flavin-dependent oxidoreductase [Candidatus Nitrosocosmicus sp.]|nr:LLM class flavin-dependent oxidoreductase [Candidatus Nitrosocosmicus sp.]